MKIQEFADKLSGLLPTLRVEVLTDGVVVKLNDKGVKMQPILEKVETITDDEIITIASFLDVIFTKSITDTTAKEVLWKMYETGEDAETIIERENLWEIK